MIPAICTLPEKTKENDAIIMEESTTAERDRHSATGHY